MHETSYHAEFTLDRTPDEVFDAVTDVRGWWSQGLEGASAELGDEFTFADGDDSIRRARFRLVEVVPARRVVWEVLDSYLGFVDDHEEWTGTRVVFDIAESTEGTTLHFVHEGLTPSSECYEACSRGWDFYLDQSLPQLVTTGAGQPIPNA